MADPFIGEIRAFGFNFAPNGWAFCNGQTMAISQFQALFAILGTTYGGDGRQTFQLPNLQGSTLMGTGTGPGLTPRTLGEPVGENAVSLSVAELPNHDHTVSGRVAAASAEVSNPAGALLGRPFTRGSTPKPTQAYSSVDEVNTALSPLAIGAQGQSLPHENRQPYVVLNYCIALNGEYPVRS